ncbi:charged multivesicular body protein 4b-like [Trachinotus anak]|uniref:charged multivesicular body protein 4b-like n=1 Tax=Trachinotus anak TaxID=443729 RepID=UPI0039F1DC37
MTRNNILLRLLFIYGIPLRCNAAIYCHPKSRIIDLVAPGYRKVRSLSSVSARARDLKPVSKGPSQAASQSRSQMSLLKLFSGGEKVRKKPSQQEEMETLSEREQLLMEKKEHLKKKIQQELMFAKKNSRKNRRVALQALRRKKWYEKHLKYIDCAVKAMRSTDEHIDIVNKVNDLIRDITEEQDVTRDMSDTLHTSVTFGVEFDEDALLAELERLEKNLDESVFEKDSVEERVLCPEVLPTASLSHLAQTEEDEVEHDLEYLRRWANEAS